MVCIEPFSINHDVNSMSFCALLNYRIPHKSFDNKSWPQKQTKTHTHTHSVIQKRLEKVEWQLLSVSLENSLMIKQNSNNNEHTMQIRFSIEFYRFYIYSQNSSHPILTMIDDRLNKHHKLIKPVMLFFLHIFEHRLDNVCFIQSWFFLHLVCEV